MTQHLHSTHVPGCFRCDLSEDEARDHAAVEWDDITEVRALRARLAAVEALADPDYPPPPPDERGAAGWRFAMDHVRAALETDTTKEN